jgi:hypothetical protein
MPGTQHHSSLHECLAAELSVLRVQASVHAWARAEGGKSSCGRLLLFSHAFMPEGIRECLIAPLSVTAASLDDATLLSLPACVIECFLSCMNDRIVRASALD